MPTQQTRTPARGRREEGKRLAPGQRSDRHPGRRPAPRRKRKNRRASPVRLLLLLLLLAVVLGAVIHFLPRRHTPWTEGEIPDWIDVQLIEMDGHARRGTALTQVRDIAVHYVGNPGSTARQNRDYFNQPGVNVASHFVVGLEGEVIQCIPTAEISSATNERNNDTISIEVCHPDETGQFSGESYQSLVRLTAWLCDYCGIGRERVIRHYDVTGKPCPLYFVEHPEAWAQFLADVEGY